MKQQLLNIASNHPEGFTVDLEMNMIAEGYVISVPETQDSFGDEGLERALEVAKANNYFIGGWYNHTNGKFYWDASIVVNDLNQALEIGKKFGQLAIFDLTSQNLIWID